MLRSTMAYWMYGLGINEKRRPVVNIKVNDILMKESLCAVMLI